MNVLLSVVQVIIALLSIAGGAYKVLMYDQLAKMPQAAVLPRGGWIALGVFEVLCGLLIIPGLFRRLTPLAATALAVESLGLAVLYARYSLEVTPSNPLVWVVLIAVMAGFVAYGRFTTR
ncbi:MAG TPA: DoxX family protein [Thermoanaerobaculia bacterium]